MLCYEGTYNHHIWIIFLSPGHFLLHFVFLDVLVSVQHSLFYLVIRFQFSSVHFSLLVMFDFSRPHGPQHARPPCPSPTPSSPKPMSIESVMPSNHLILCRPLLLPSVFPRIRVFSNESVLHIRWPKYWSFSFNVSPSNDISDLGTS